MNHPTYITTHCKINTKSRIPPNIDYIPLHWRTRHIDLSDHIDNPIEDHIPLDHCAAPLQQQQYALVRAIEDSLHEWVEPVLCFD